jgi:toxin ParE1/3/4
VNHRPVKLRPRADADIVKAAHWYEKERAGLGSAFMSEFLASSEKCADNPEIYRVVNLAKRLRKCAMSRFPYLIYFTNEEFGIMIHAVLHAHRGDHALQRRIK